KEHTMVAARARTAQRSKRPCTSGQMDGLSPRTGGDCDRQCVKNSARCRRGDVEPQSVDGVMWIAWSLGLHRRIGRYRPQRVLEEALILLRLAGLLGVATPAREGSQRDKKNQNSSHIRSLHRGRRRCRAASSIYV